MEEVISAITKIRNARQGMNIPPSKKAKLFVEILDQSNANIFKDTTEYFVSVGGASEVLFDSETMPQDVIKIITQYANLYIPTGELVDYEKEKQRLTKEKEKLVSEIDRVDKKLANKGFVEKAPAALIEEEKAKKEKFVKMLEEVNASLAKINK